MLSQKVEYQSEAAPSRVVRIVQGVDKLSLGISPVEVKAVLGEPDEINNTYDSIFAKAAKVIGYSFVFLIQRKSESGSVIEKDEKLVRIHFDLNNKVSRIDKIGF